MREIKFRVWHKRYKKMYEVHDLILNSIPNEKNPKVWANCWGKDIIEDKNIILHIEDLDIQQFTGLKDKNGKEIYEGDVVKWGHTREWSRENPIRIAEVKINPDIQFHSQVGVFKFGNFAYADSIDKDLEVIGNIYENPELLTN